MCREAKVIVTHGINSAPGIDEELERDEDVAAIEARMAPVLIYGDEVVEGFAAIAKKLGMSRQRLTYGLSMYAELAFIRRDVGPKPVSMVSSLQAVNQLQLIETRVRQEQQDRGRARGRANKRTQMWHLSGPRSDD